MLSSRFTTKTLITAVQSWIFASKTIASVFVAQVILIRQLPLCSLMNSWTWKLPGNTRKATMEMLPLVTVSIDGVRFTAEGFTPDNSATGGVTHVSFRLGDNSRVMLDTGKFTLDDLVYLL